MQSPPPSFLLGDRAQTLSAPGAPCQAGTYLQRGRGSREQKEAGGSQEEAQKARHAPENHKDQAERQQNHECPMHGLGETEGGSY